MDFGSFENTIDKNIETDKASDKFDQQLQAYKDAGNSLTLAKSGVEMATASMHEAKDKLSEASDKANTVTKAIEAYIGKVKDITVKAKVDDADMEQAINNRKKLIENETKLLEDHRKENKEILTRHFYDMSNMMSRNEGVWLSNGWVKTLLLDILAVFPLYGLFDYLFCSIMHRQVKKECHGIILKLCRDTLFLHACNCFLLLFGYKLLVTNGKQITIFRVI